MMKTTFAAAALAGTVSAKTLSIDKLGSYPGYTGTADITGKAYLAFEREDTVTISYHLDGVEAECAKPGTAANSCGIHIHAGMSCADATQPGGHYYNTETISSDPWATASYTVKGKDAYGEVKVQYGYDYDATEGRALVVHDYSGARVTCALLSPPPRPEYVQVRDLGKYPGYAGDLSVKGQANLEFQGTEVVIKYNLAGVEGACFSAGSAANSCGIHIHEGTSCDDASQPGGHYFNPDTISSDPWATASYKSLFGFANGEVKVDYGYDFDQTAGRVLVVHDHSGARVTCAPIGSVKPDGEIAVHDLGKYPDYTGSVKARGYAKLEFTGNSVKILYDLDDVESECSSPAEGVGNSCGIHIHAGTSCADATQPGGHYFNADTISSDPWATAVYTSEGKRARGEIVVKYGYDFDATKGRALVVHDRSGARVTCALLTEGDVTMLQQVEDVVA